MHVDVSQAVFGSKRVFESKFANCALIFYSLTLDVTLFLIFSKFVCIEVSFAFELSDYLFFCLKAACPTRPSLRIVLWGKFGTGKTMTLCQAVHHAHLQGWIVFVVPDGKFFFSCRFYGSKLVRHSNPFWNNTPSSLSCPFLAFALKGILEEQWKSQSLRWLLLLGVVVTALSKKAKVSVSGFFFCALF